MLSCFRNPGQRSFGIAVNLLWTLAALTYASAWADPQPDVSSGSNRESAVWAPSELEFTYTGFTTKYSCDGLRDKMSKVLLKLGAREDLEVRPFGCVRIQAPDLITGVTIKMQVLQPAEGREPAVAAHWKKVDLLGRREAVDAAADCELIGELKRKVLPLFATRNVEYNATCERGHILAAGTRLKAEVLVADSSPTVKSAAR